MLLLQLPCHFTKSMQFWKFPTTPKYIVTKLYKTIISILNSIKENMICGYWNSKIKYKIMAIKKNCTRKGKEHWLNWYLQPERDWFFLVKIIWICQSPTQTIMGLKKMKKTTTTAFLISNTVALNPDNHSRVKLKISVYVTEGHQYT